LLKLLDLIKSSSIRTYIHYPYAVEVELDANVHSEIVEYVKEKCEEYAEETL